MNAPFITTADDRLAAPGRINMVIAGASGAGKTSLARTLPAETTLFIDLEAGTKALADWRGDVIKVRDAAARLQVHPWELARALACIMSGPDPAADPVDTENPYSKVNFDSYCRHLGGPETFAKYHAVFWDSVTVAGRHCFTWSQAQPEAFSEKTGKKDTRGAYGLHGREMIKWLTVIQHIPDKSTILAAILNEDDDDVRGKTYSLQIDGGKSKNELPGIFDNVMTLAIFTDERGATYRALVCTGMNQWGYPAKDRSGALEILEPPDLAKIIAKTTSGPRLGELVRDVPQDFLPAVQGVFNPNIKG
jgi:hypothetical protein